jgi:amino acid adenylation domain-containing protein
MISVPLERAIADWNHTEVAYPSHLCLHELFEQNAQRAPDAVAIISGDEHISYQSLDRKANQIARHLRKQGVRLETLVGICARRSPDFVAAILGLLKAGGAFLPLDPDYPRERLALMIRDTGLQTLITEPAFLPRVPFHGTTLCLDDDQNAVSGESQERLVGGAGPENLAYVIFTSGSTGQPKGIALRHTGVVNNLVDLNSRFSVGAGDRVLAVSSLSFDMSVYEILGTLAGGATIVLPDPGRSSDANHLLELISRHQVTVWNSAPGLLVAFVEHVEMRCDVAALPIRLVLLGGDWVPLDLTERIRRFAPAAKVIVMGGATEASIHSTIFPVDEIDPAWKTVPYGRPMANQRTYVLDERGQPTPIGEVGELYLGGIGLARGYWNRPDETADRFVPNPFGHGERIYRTGDLVRYFPDGTLELIGRIDHQFKIRGFRVEPKEIEAELLRYPGVRQALAMVREDVRGDRRLVAYVVLESDGSLELWAPKLRAYLEEKLPPHLVPQAFVPLAKLPLSPNGKVDRAALPKPIWRRPLREEEKPRSLTEQALAELWTELLRVDEVGREDDFTALGGHSLLCLQLASRIRARFKVELPLRALLSSTLAQMAELIGAHAEAPTPAIPRASESVSPGPASYPLALGQERLLLLEQFRIPDGPCPYNEVFALELEGTLDADALVRSLHDLAARHTSWRSAFVPERNQTVQRVLPADRISIERVDLSDLATEGQGQRLTALVRRESHTRFAIEEGEVVRVFLIQLGRQRHILLLSMHHLVMDGWSMSIVARELDALYRAQIVGSLGALPPLSIEYGDFAAWERAHEAELAATHLPYWKDHLQGAPTVLNLPVSGARPAAFSFRGTHHRAPIGADTARALRALASAEGVSLSTALLAAYALLLGRNANQQDVVIGLVLSSRNRVELESLVGFLADTVPARIRWEDGATFRALLRAARETAMGAREHQACPLERIVGAVGLTREASTNPLFQAMFVFQTAPMVPPTLGPVAMMPVEICVDIAKCDLTLGIEEREGALVADWEYATDLFDPQTIPALASQFEALLRSATAAPDRALAELPLLGEEERRRLVEMGRAERLGDGRELSLCELFDRQVKALPEAVAVVCGERCTTYAELDARAAAVAARLRAMGVGPESRVCLQVDRSLELVIGVLGILKAGAAYVPIEIDCPRKRLAFILNDSAAQVLLTETSRAAELAGLGCPVLTVEGADSEERVEPGVTGANLAYIIYTSGSTGEPKGVLIEHGMVSRLLSATADWFGFGSEEVWPLFHSISFDFSVWEMWGALLYGGRIVIVPREIARSPQNFFELLAREKATVLCQTPQAFRGLSASAIGQEQLESLRLVIFGGESLDPEILRCWFAKYGDERPRLVNMYGITETTVHATYRVMAKSDLEAGRSLIGRALPDVDLHVLGKRLEPVPVGVVGELYVGGPGVARGYSGRPDWTAERFLPNPYGNGARLYRSGDLARRLSNGELEYLGRADQQVKVRGYRVELGEIEMALLRHAGVGDAVVDARTTADGSKRLVAYWVGKDGARPTASDLRRHLEERLPRYMVPAVVVNLEKMPLLSSGKVDRRSLPEPEGRPDLEAVYRAPESPVERSLAEIWKAVLGVEQIGLDDSFFELGGDSLRALQALRASRQAGLDLTVQNLFDHPTIAGLAKTAIAKRATPARPEAASPPPLRKRPDPDSFPMSLNQERTDLGLRTAELFPLEGFLDVAALERSINQVVARHAVLRACFPMVEGKRVQRILPELHLKVSSQDFRRPPEDRPLESMSRFFLEAVESLDGSEGPLLAIRVARVDEARYVLFMAGEEILGDRLSTQIFWEEVARAYAGHLAGTPVQFDSPPLEYADFAVWQRALYQGPVAAAQLGLLRQHLDGAAPLDLAPAGLEPRKTWGPKGRWTWVPPRVAAERFLSAAQKRGATNAMSLLAAWAISLARRAKRTDLPVTALSANRNQEGTARMLGKFQQQMILRLRLPPRASLTDALSSVQDALVAAVGQDVAPVEFNLLKWVKFKNVPIVDLGLVGLKPWRWDGIEAVVIPSKPAPIAFDLQLTCLEGRDPSDLKLQFLYRTDRIDAQTISGLQAELDSLLEDAGKDPTRPLV